MDTGYPGDRESVLASLSAVGSSPEAVAAVLVTHAHNDHIGSAEYLSRTYGTPVYATRPKSRTRAGTSSTRSPSARCCRTPGGPACAVGRARAALRRHRPYPGHRATAVPGEGALDLPGRPVPVHTPGHTAGHCAFHLPDAGIVISGDGLVSGHPTSRTSGPQLLPTMFHRDLPGRCPRWTPSRRSRVTSCCPVTVPCTAVPCARRPSGPGNGPPEPIRPLRTTVAAHHFEVLGDRVPVAGQARDALGHAVAFVLQGGEHLRGRIGEVDGPRACRGRAGSA